MCLTVEEKVKGVEMKKIVTSMNVTIKTTARKVRQGISKLKNNIVLCFFIVKNVLY